jgi:hypothetical protein
MSNPITIIRGEDRTVQLGVRNADGSPYDLSGATEIVITLENENGTTTDFKLSLGAMAVVTPLAGLMSLTITAAQSAILKVGNTMDMQASITSSGLIRKVLFEGILTVLKETP